jgi:hypothetical protein
MSDEFALARNKYKPERIRLLLIAESPPSSGGFFYFEETTGKDHLFRETMKALKLWPERRVMGSHLDKRLLLKEFRSRGFFLIDTCEEPIDQLMPSERKSRTLKGSANLVGVVRKLNPEHIIIVKKTVFAPVRDALLRSGLGGRILNSKPVPFPSHGNQRVYRRTLRRVVRRLDI